MILEPHKRRWIMDELQHLADWQHANRETNEPKQAFHELSWRVEESIADIWQHLGGTLTPYGRIPYGGSDKSEDPRPEWAVHEAKDGVG